MPETFVPLVAAAAPVSVGGFTSLNLKATPQTSVRPASEAFKTVALPAATPQHSEACAKPVVTLQRNGDVVSSIRIECGCGQVIELACVY